jgi:hypothetical protein
MVLAAPIHDTIISFSGLSFHPLTLKGSIFPLFNFALVVKHVRALPTISIGTMLLLSRSGNKKPHYIEPFNNTAKDSYRSASLGPTLKIESRRK